jgi:hypothetical protein
MTHHLKDNNVVAIDGSSSDLCKDSDVGGIKAN